MSSKYSEAERRMLELKLGGTVVVHHQAGALTDDSNDYLEHIGEFGPRTIFRTLCVYDSAAAFALMVEHGIWPKEQIRLDTYEQVIAVWWKSENGFEERVYTNLAEHPDKETAVRYAIVQAVIAKRKSGMDAA